MVATENGYAPKENYLSELLSEITELKNPAMPSWDVIEFSPLLDSSNMTVRQWSVIGEEIALHYDDYDGFVILHGTDTMCYTASALSFMQLKARPKKCVCSSPAGFSGAIAPLKYHQTV